MRTLLEQMKGLVWEGYLAQDFQNGENSGAYQFMPREDLQRVKEFVERVFGERRIHQGQSESIYYLNGGCVTISDIAPNHRILRRKGDYIGLKAVNQDNLAGLAEEVGLPKPRSLISANT